MKKLIYIIIFGITASVVLSGLRSFKSDSEYDLESFAELPVQVGGRIKPLDSVARNTLLLLSGRQKVVTAEGTELSPIQWFMDLTMRPEIADNYPIFKIEFPDDLGLAGLAKEGERYYSFNELLPFSEELRKLHSEVDPEPKKRSAYDNQIVDINNGLMRYHRIMHSLHPIGGADRLDKLDEEYQSYVLMITPGMAELRKQQAGQDYDADRLNRFIAFADDYLKLSQTALLRVVPPPAPIDPLEDWKNIGLELLDVMKGDALSPYVTSYASLTMDYRAGNADAFNQKVAELRQRFIADFPNSIGRVHFERLFNAFQPFYIAMQLYVLVFLIVCISWLRWPQELSRCAFWLILLAFGIHTFGLLSRMYIQERYGVFVTNLYSSAVFVGWGAVLLGALIEKFYKNGIGAAMASLVGFCTLIVAHHLSMSGDTMEMMRAVLDSNFWLATHVTVITFGYSAMFLAGALALVFVAFGVFSRKFNKETARSLSAMVYGITCFATLFSLVGTILGGIWADQSWGRFWGWDPKENGALMIVVMGAIFLHARWGGICRERGLMSLAICGNIITAWSWFGTNLLGVGLHSYGFTDSGFYWLLAFWSSQCIFIATALLPWRYWRSEFGQSNYRKQRKRILIAAEDA
ncbi:cytochrome c biogenesis protein CcsA [Coraliomargarita algicola]|uniref:Cytochrome c biogenesis protein CcsA n=1 Tax=Coraliomargarita algicola TaxID=3092156 RepID=A0ABZ0RDY3_9BACT|nr:cytochrome c biogenesis protein CcsA [Coraliomargarita sp. J2-16]WPJ94364.1 cytochrome c biogenesis protein CcsA [Coraliomargarita sp. J2-16]